jgi:hypothetical protein
MPKGKKSLFYVARFLGQLLNYVYSSYVNLMRWKNIQTLEMAILTSKSLVHPVHFIVAIKYHVPRICNDRSNL